MTIEDIAKAMGVSVSTVHAWETGRYLPSRVHRTQLAALWHRLDPLTLRQRFRPDWSVPDEQLLAEAHAGRAEIERSEGFSRPIGATDRIVNLPESA